MRGGTGDGASNCDGESNDYQPETAFDDQLRKDDYGITSLNAGFHPFVVFGTCDVNVKKVIKPLSVVAVVCNGELHYGVWGNLPHPPPLHPLQTLIQKRRHERLRR